MPLAVAGLSWVTRNFHGLPGRWRLVNWLDQHEREFAGMEPKTVRFAGRLQICVNPMDENGRRIYINGYQPRERLTRHFVRLLKPGDCMLDVGANVGYYTMVCREIGWPDRLCACFRSFAVDLSAASEKTPISIPTPASEYIVGQ